MSKHAYETPQLFELGAFEDLTQAGSTGLYLDATYPAGTPITDAIYGDGPFS
jgi:hypothetical protein